MSLALTDIVSLIHEIDDGPYHSPETTGKQGEE